MAKSKKQFKRVKSTGVKVLQTRARKTKDPYPKAAKEKKRLRLKLEKGGASNGI